MPKQLHCAQVIVARFYRQAEIAVEPPFTGLCELVVVKIPKRHTPFQLREFSYGHCAATGAAARRILPYEIGAPGGYGVGDHGLALECVGGPLFDRPQHCAIYAPLATLMGSPPSAR